MIKPPSPKEELEYSSVLHNRIKELEQQNQALMAQVEQLQVMFIELRGYHVCNLRTDSPFIGRVGVHENWFKLSQIIDATPAQCLAARDTEIKAQAVEDAIHSTRQSFDGLGPKWFCKVENLETYVNQLRQQAKVGE